VGERDLALPLLDRSLTPPGRGFCLAPFLAARRIYRKYFFRPSPSTSGGNAQVDEVEEEIASTMPIRCAGALGSASGRDLRHLLYWQRRALPTLIVNERRDQRRFFWKVVLLS
jgi:hypothetical protein